MVKSCADLSIKDFRCCILLIVLTGIQFYGKGNTVPKGLLLTGNGNIPSILTSYPPWTHEFQNEMVLEIIKGIIDIDTTCDLRVLNKSQLEKYDLIISNSLFLTPNKDQLNALYEFVAGGKSFLSLHCGILSFLNWEKYEEFMGGIFIGGPSTEHAKFKVYTSNNEFWGYPYSFRNTEEHPVSAVVEDFETEDELYYFQPSTAAFYVIARAENHPVMWWHPLHKGKVMSLTLGHDSIAKSAEGYRQLLTNGIMWLTGYPLIREYKSNPVSTRQLYFKPFLSLDSLTCFGKHSSIRYEIIHSSPADLFKTKLEKNTNLNVVFSGKTGSGFVSIAATTDFGRSSKKIFSFNVVKDGIGNVAAYHGNTIAVSSMENESGLFKAENMLDGDSTTRWSSAACDTAWFQLDLKRIYNINQINVYWEAAYASQYQVLGSANGNEWILLDKETEGNGNLDSISFNPTQIRYIKLLATRRAVGKWGYSILDIGVFTEQK